MPAGLDEAALSRARDSFTFALEKLEGEEGRQRQHKGEAGLDTELLGHLVGCSVSFFAPQTCIL